MAEPDPFGRKKDEDPLAQMGWSDAPATPAETQRTSEAAEAAATTASGDAFGGRVRVRAPQPQRPGRQRRGFALGCLPVLFIVAAIFATAAAIIIPIARSIDDAVDDIDEAVTTPAPAEPPRGIAEGSMLLRGNLAPALRQLRGELGGRLRYVRIEAERVDVQVARGGSLVSAQARWDGDPQTFPPVETGAAGTTFSWSQVDPSAPRRFARAAAQRAGQPTTAFNYAVLIDAAGLKWQVFLRDGTHFTASTDGRRVEKV